MKGREFLFILVACTTITAPDPFPFDRLSPYKENSHGSLRSVRDISECQHVDWNNKTYEEYHLKLQVPLSTDIRYELYRYEDTVESELENPLSIHRRKYLIGSIAYVENPFFTFSVLEPMEPGGCRVKYFRAMRRTVSATAQNRFLGCKLATNAGYFSMSSGRCLGNIVSDGRIVQTTRDQNANFGVRHDGSIVVGYIPEEEILDGSFRQLVSGVMWLVRNGTNYVNESMKLECPSHQDTGKMSTFVDVLSARTAVGHDDRGRIVLAQVEGQTHRRGANLHEFADLLLAHGVVNAINLDGGGSSTFVHNQVLINYPSDHCPGHPAYRCERQVSTILCFHDVQCLEPNCTGHGTCVQGECSCHRPWIGSTCARLNCSLEDCSGHGNCTDGVCKCEAGWRGDTCEKACSTGYHGRGCKSRCWCGHSLCDPVTGKCKCPPGFTGFRCLKKCTVGFYGHNCLLRCPSHNCSGHGKCSSVDGSCVCTANWTGLACNQTVLSFSSRSMLGSFVSSRPVGRVTTSQQLTTYTRLPLNYLTSSPGLHSCSDTNLTVRNWNEYYEWIVVAVCLIALSSLVVHVSLCVKMRRHSGKVLAAIHSPSQTRTKRLRKKRKRFTPILQESSSDCSI